MKPLELTMTAFGPYCGAEKINFTQIANNSLFLITGPTGAGKTTIFDAICYALYGETSGNVRSGESLKSGYSSGEDLTSVSFRFQLRDKEYYIERSPRQEKRKAKGEGYTSHNGNAVLVISGRDKPIVGIKKVNEEIAELIGLNAQQFRQIMMIPQGSFQELLTAPSKDREEILKTLFNTAIFSRIQWALKERENSLTSSINSRILVRNTHIKSITARENTELGDEINSDTPHAERVLELLRQKITEDKKIQTELKKSLKTIDNERKAAAAEKEKALQNNAGIAEFKELKEKEKELRNRTGEITQMKEATKRAKSAAKVIPVEDRFRSAEERNRSLKNELEQIDEKIRNHEKKHAENESAIKKLDSEKYRSELDRERNEISEMKRHCEIARTLNHRLKEKTDLHKDCIKTKNEVLLLERNRDELAGTIRMLNAGLMDLSSLKEKAAAIDSELKNFRDTLSRIDQIEDVNIQIANTGKERAGAMEEIKNHESCLSRIEEKIKRINSLNAMDMAAKLASMLEEGKPCPVCGSKDHISPARHSHDPAEAGDMKAFEAEHKKQTALILETSGTLKICEGKIIELEKLKKSLETELMTLAGTDTFDISGLPELRSEVQRKADNLQSRKAESADSINLLSENEGKLRESENLLKEYEARLKEKTAEDNRLSSDLKALDALIDESENELPENFLNDTEIEKKLSLRETSLKNKISEIDDSRAQYNESARIMTELTSYSRHIKEQAEKLSLELDQCKTELRNAIVNEGFEGFDSYHSSKMDSSVIEKREAEIRNFEDSLSRVTAQIDVMAKTMNSSEPEPIEPHDEKIRILDDRYEAENTRLSDLAGELSKNSEIENAICGINSEIGSLEEEYYTMGRLSRVAEGRNSMKLSFERYILTAFLDDIINAANSRLHRMSSGRYRLRRSDTVEDRRSAGGLDLEVSDSYTGLYRHVNTLSGGESFKASLSMALGLSDVVQEYSGGVQLDTMFIDEGFGTLDPESLDSAMDCLMDIQKSGRLVGIISHVPDLKEKIKTQLEVYAGTTGSYTNNFRSSPGEQS